MTTLVSLAELGVDVVEGPAEANVLLVTGGSNLKSKRELETAYNALQAPRIVVAVGSCAATMGIFKGGYSMTGPIDAIIPIHLYVTGCPPRPQAILGALAEALQLKVEGLTGLLHTPEGFRGDPHVDQDKCIGCSACAHVCPADAIEIEDGGRARVVRFMRQACVFCASCQDVCPTKAVELRSGDTSWCREKGASKSEATLPLARCGICGNGFIPEAQIAWAMKTVSDKRALAQADRVALQGRLRVCMECRRGRIPDVREAKRLLTSLERTAS
jgi:Ni,Fe-hydrogenase III small subunit/NAD-dependent dihydropyrimidine dehydrogenase PreA subunit